jgi:hypothetical protein
MMRAVPDPLHSAEMKTHPSLARVNGRGLLDLETEDASSSSAARLFSLFSPEKRTPARATQTIDSNTEAATITLN